MNHPNPQTVVVNLEALESNSSVPQTIDSAKEWRATILKTQSYLSDTTHPVVFIGKVGGGKSSLIGIAANLIVGESPTDRPSLKSNSVLAIGSGRTTVCEVQIRSCRPGDSGRLGLLINPVTEEALREEILLYAESEWFRQHPEARTLEEEDATPTAQEIQRVIRGMTGYAEYQETYTEGHVRKRRTVRPLDTIVSQFDTPEALAQHLLDRAKLQERTKTSWWWDAPSEENMRALKALFDAVNQGREPTATLPRQMTVVVPTAVPGGSSGLEMTLIDTRGLDGAIESREDIQRFLRDPRTLLVLCASFKDAPDAAIRDLLQSMAGDAELRLAIPRTILLLVDMGDADQVNGADGDREAGQEIKIDECHRALQAMPYSVIASMNIEQVVAFDALKDDRMHLVAAINQGISRIRGAAENALYEQMRDAEDFLNAAEDELRPVLRERVDHAIRETLAGYLPIAAPLQDPISGLHQAIRQTRYASVVYAACRRNGAYAGLDLYAAVKAEASRAVTEWLDTLINAVDKRLTELESDPELHRINDYIRLSKRRYFDAQIEVTQDYARRVQEEVRTRLKSDPIWTICSQEWGKGGGFKNKVMEHLQQWLQRQQGMTAHEQTNAEAHIPLWGEVARTPQAPSFTLHIRNLRSLKLVKWNPEPLSLLIGANGTGKTTLLQTLKLLRLAYERGLSEAVKQVLGGSSNIRHWDAAEDEPIEIGIDLGEVRWRVQLATEGGSVYLAGESLYEGGREVFSLDSLGAFIYKDERLELNSHLGLRKLMDRGVHEPAVRAMVSFIRHISVHHDPDIWELRWNGSNTSDDRVLHSRGSNALTVLRRWHLDRTNRHRYQFVLDSLIDAFPNVLTDMDFQEAGNTLVARFYRPGMELPTPLSSEANGVLQLLILACEVANAEDESLLAIDEPENGLHPYALRTFLAKTERWAKQHRLTVLLATHSMVLLDAMTPFPEQVYVMKRLESESMYPPPLDQLCNRDWLENFKLGDLYEQGEIGSNEDVL
ncbi:MAG: AAA family ATPase [Bacillota bacterium]